MSSCLALQIYTALVSVFFAWLFFRPRKPARPARGSTKRARRAPATGVPAADGAEVEPFLDPETIAAWNGEFETRMIAPTVPATPAAATAARAAAPRPAPQVPRPAAPAVARDDPAAPVTTTNPVAPAVVPENRTVARENRPAPVATHLTSASEPGAQGMPAPAALPNRSRRSKPATGRSRAAARHAAARAARMRRVFPRGGALSGS